MADSHIQGRVADTNQLGAIPCTRGYEFAYTTITESICLITAHVTNPVLLEIWPTITTAFNAGTTNVVNIVDQNGNVITTFPDPTVTGIQTYRTILVQKNLQLSLQYTFTGTKPTQGQGLLILRLSGLGTGHSLNLGSLT